MAIFAEDITFQMPGRSPVAGDYTGHDDVVAFLQKLGEGSNGTFTMTVQDILDNGDETVLALVTHLAHRDDAELDLAGPGRHVHEPRVLRAQRSRRGRLLVIAARRARGCLFG